MNRRDFVDITIAFSLATIPIPVDGRPALGRLWVPSQQDVDDWLEYYKIAVTSTSEILMTRLADAFNPPQVQGFDDAAQRALDAKWYTLDITVRETLNFEKFERLFLTQSRDRYKVGHAQGVGYTAGLDERPRHNISYPHASNEAFGWYNGWATGDKDRRFRKGEIPMERGRGVSWPKPVGFGG